MSRFTLSALRAIRGRQKFYQLVVDGQCLFDAFWQEIAREGNLVAEPRRILAITDQVAQMKQPLPKTVFRELQGRKKSDHVKEYEVKTSNLRVYLFHEEARGKLSSAAARKTRRRPTSSGFAA